MANKLSGHVLQRDQVGTEDSKIDATEPQITSGPIHETVSSWFYYQVVVDSLCNDISQPVAVVGNTSKAVEKNVSTATADVSTEQILPEGLETAQVQCILKQLIVSFSEARHTVICMHLFSFLNEKLKFIE